jgi:phosphoribosylaminoimidazole-succinocarboxamide synthase
MSPDHGELLYEGKAKRIYATDHSDQVLVEYKNDATAFNAQKKAQLADKGRLNCQISARLFELLEGTECSKPLPGVGGRHLDAGAAGGGDSAGSGAAQHRDRIACAVRRRLRRELRSVQPCWIFITKTMTSVIRC